MSRLALLALLLALALGPVLPVGVKGLQGGVAASGSGPAATAEAARIADAATRVLLARPLHDAAGTAAGDGASGAGGSGAASGEGAASATTAAGSSGTAQPAAGVVPLHRSRHDRLAAAAAARRAAAPPPAPPAPPAWELELAPAVAALYPAREPNGTLLRGPPRLAGTYKGAAGAQGVRRGGECGRKLAAPMSGVQWAGVLGACGFGSVWRPRPRRTSSAQPDTHTDTHARS